MISIWGVDHGDDISKMWTPKLSMKAVHRGFAKSNNSDSIRASHQAAYVRAMKMNQPKIADVHQQRALASGQEARASAHKAAALMGRVQRDRKIVGGAGLGTAGVAGAGTYAYQKGKR